MLKTILIVQNDSNIEKIIAEKLCYTKITALVCNMLLTTFAMYHNITNQSHLDILSKIITILIFYCKSEQNIFILVSIFLTF